METVGLGLMLFGLVWAAGFGFVHFRAVGKAKAAESWPSAMGKVLSSEVVVEESRDSDDGTTTWYNPVVTYSYSVARTHYEGRRLRFGNPRSGSRKKAEAALAAYPVGASVVVHHDPERPAEAVLETSKPGPLYLVLAGAGLGFVVFGLVWKGL